MIPTLLSLVLSAPIPPAKPPRPIQRCEMVGVWRVDCFTVHLRSDGSYGAAGDTTTWHGSWSLVGNEVRVMERTTHDDTPGQAYPWGFRVKRCQGKIVGDGVRAEKVGPL